ncbi:unnamed protein product, partial [Staurois parvus]
VPPAVSPVLSSSGCRHLSSGFCSLRRRDVRGRNGGKFENDKKRHSLNSLKSHSKTLPYQTISHTFCPECFVRRPVCIFTVLSAWKLRNIHGVQKASL